MVGSKSFADDSTCKRPLKKTIEDVSYDYTSLRSLLALGFDARRILSLFRTMPGRRPSDVRHWHR